jgi:hypothetical protein
MLMIYDYRVTVSLEDSPQRTDAFDHAIVADTSDNRSAILRHSLECVKGRTLTRACLLSVRALTLREISLITGTALNARPVPGIRLVRRIARPPTGSWTVWPPRIQSFREVVLMDCKDLGEHAIGQMFPGQFCIRDWRSCTNLEPSLARQLRPHHFACSSRLRCGR